MPSIARPTVYRRWGRPKIYASPLCDSSSYPHRCGADAAAVKKLEGTHDFTGFTASGTSVEDKVEQSRKLVLGLMKQGSFDLYLLRNGFLIKAEFEI